MNIFHKKAFKMSVAGVMAAVLICLGVLVNPGDVTAKDTLQGIQQIVSANTPEKPFRILEIVPDVATTTFKEELSPVEGTTFEQSMGSIGYYIGGQEPVLLERDLGKFNGSATRKQFVDSLYNYSFDSSLLGSKPGALAGITEKVAADGTPKDEKPLYFKEYKEHYASEYTEEEIAQKLLAGELRQIQHTSNETASAGITDQDTTTTGVTNTAIGTTTNEVVKKHVDMLTGISMDVVVPSYIDHPEKAYVPGNFVLTYHAIAQPVGGVQDSDPARLFFEKGTQSAGLDNDYFKNTTEELGYFDPGFVYESTVDNAFYAATFAMIDQSAVPEANRVDRGYVPTQGQEIIPGTAETTGTLWSQTIQGKQIYQAQTDEDGNIVSYKYIGHIEQGNKIDGGIGYTYKIKLVDTEGKDVTAALVQTQTTMSDTVSDNTVSSNSVPSSAIVPSITPSLTPSVTPSVTPSTTPSVTPSVTQTVTPSATITPTPSVTPSVPLTDSSVITDSITTTTENVVLPKNNSIADQPTITVEEVQSTEPQAQQTKANVVAGKYYILTFQYELPENGKEIKYPYYYVESFYKYESTVETVIDHGAKEYSLNLERPLVQNPIGEGRIAYKEEKLADSQKLFVFEFDRGRGLYNLNIDQTNPTDRYVKNLPVYFEGGFYNNEWLKRNVFDRDAGDQCKALNITVNTIPAGKVTEADIANADMLYISKPDTSILPYAEFIGGREAAEERTTYTDYESTTQQAGSSLKCDLTAMNVLAILKQVSANKKPVVYDYQLLNSTEESVKESNVYKLMKLLTLEDLAAFYGAHVSVTAESSMQDAINEEALHGVFKTVTKPYVDENKYCFDLMNTELNTYISGDETHYQLLNDFLSAAFKKDVITERFQEVLDDIENENLYRETDGGKAPLDTKVSMAATLRYIINFAKKRPQADKAVINVLEVQPCASYDLSVTNDKEKNPKDPSKQIPRGILTYKKGTKDKQEIANQLGTEITLTQMTTAELIGKNTDLNASYDLIYIGLNTGKMNTTKQGKTDYNDNAMDGLVYSNVGDTVYCKAVMAGLLDTDYSDNDRDKDLRATPTKKTDYGRYRFSGNDINEETRKKLENFIQTGYPVLLENDILKVDAVTKKRTPNSDLIDNSSYMYEFLLNATEPGRKVFKKDMPNLIRRANMTENLFNWYLNLAKPMITLSGNADKAQTEPFTLQKADDGFYYLSYEFVLTNAAAADTSTTFDCRLYIDINADGKFSKTKEKVKDIVVTDQDGNRLDTDGEGRYSLTPGRSYIVKRAISNEYAGIVPWELEVVQKDNETRRANKTGYYVIKKTDSEPIKILQICSSGQTYKNNLNLEEAMKNKNSRFYLYINQVKDIFNISFTSIDSNEYAKRFKENKEYLNDFDMIILGFSDCYREASNEDGAMSAIREYIASGRSVLFTHDTTSFLNVDSSKFNKVAEDVYYWGYSFNTLIRDKVGLDRYGVLTSGDVGNTRRSGYGAKSGDGIWNSLTDKAQNGSKEIAYKPGSARQEMVKETQGFTYGTLSHYSVSNSNVNTYRSPFKNMDINNGQYNNEQVTQINKGQITMYPYVIQENFTVAKTHSQYYQIDLEADDDHDGESDIVVWYTISDPNKATDNNDIYAKSPNDVRNNYYIYNKGNVTYSGVGHTGIDSSAYDWEVKLFVNTMVAAYKAGLHAPKVSILENKEYTSRKIHNQYLSYDKMLNDALHQGVVEQTQDIFFVAEDVNLLEGDQTLSVKYYFENPYSSETITVNDEEVKVSELTGACPLYEAANDAGADPNSIASSKVYKFSVPVSLIRTLIVPTTEAEAADEGGAASETLEIDGEATEVGVLRQNKKNAVKIYVEVTATLKKPNSEKTQVMSAIETVSLVKQQLFDLE